MKFSKIRSNEYGNFQLGHLWFIVPFLFVVFFFCSDSLQYSLDFSDISVVDSYIEVTASGAHNRQIALVCLAIYSTFCVLFLRSRPRTYSITFVRLGFVTTVWMCLSILWSTDAQLSTKRVAVFLILLGAAYAIAGRYTHEQILATLFLVCALTLIVGVASEVAYGTFSPWQPEYRFSGTRHPNAQGLNCALLACLGVVALDVWRRYRALLYLCLAAVLFFLMLTKSRTALVGAVVAVISYELMKWKAHKIIVVAVVLSVLFLGALSVFGISFLNSFAQVALLGRDLESSAGRIPLYSECVRYCVARPITGYGYGAFWTPDRIEEVSRSVGWGLAGAHSIYLDLVLSIGVVGLVLWLGTVVSCVLRALEIGRYWRDGFAEFEFGFFASYLVIGLSESGFLLLPFPLFVSMLIAVLVGEGVKQAPASRSFQVRRGG